MIDHPATDSAALTRRRLLTAIPALALVAAGVGCSTTQADTTPNVGFVGGQPGVAILDPGARLPAPTATGRDLDDTPVASSDFASKILVINVWGSWCAPCRKEAPDLVEIAQETAADTQFLGINTRDLDVAQARAFVRAFNVPYPSLFDPSGAQLLKFTDLPPGAIPSTLILDRDYRVAARVIGVISKLSLRQLIDEIA